MSAPARPAVFLDRDGTLLDELGYLGDPARLRLLPGAARALARLERAGLPAVLITNQSGVARGLFGEDDLARVHRALERALAAEGARLAGIHVCPHLPPEPGAPRVPHPYRRACDCRKPAPGLFREAARAHGLALERSWAIGDAWRDLEAARRAGVPRLVLVATGKGAAERERVLADGMDAAFVRDLPAAIDLVLGEHEAARAS